ncbi:MAG: AbrB/MazE/SpoVT family DNA-binding domain-containing protein [Candidatus Lokiarchaeota archaeon]|nr:AbrB/MazE/SpoVT family DNA-binding domain-containing protein [Candidatus Lokiarchaeota archaeon]
MNNVKVGTHGEIVIKKKLRKKYGIEPGQEVIEFDAGDHIGIIPTKGDPIENLSGKYKWKESAKEAKIEAEKLASEEVKERY